MPYAAPAAASRGVDPPYINRGTGDYLNRNFADTTSDYVRDGTWGISSELNWHFLPDWNFTWLVSFGDPRTWGFRAGAKF